MNLGQKASHIGTVMLVGNVPNEPQSHGMSYESARMIWWDVACAIQSGDVVRDDRSWMRTLEMWIDLACEAWTGEGKPKWRIHRLNRLFFSELGLQAVSARADPSAMYVQTVVNRCVGNCLGLTMLYLLVGETIGIPLVPVLGDRHVFVRYDDGRIKQNIETTRRGRSVPDCLYSAPQRGSLRDRRLHVLSKGEFMALTLVTRAAYAYIPAESWELAKRDLDQAFALFPDCSYVHVNQCILRGLLQRDAGTNCRLDGLNELPPIAIDDHFSASADDGFGPKRERRLPALNRT